ASTAAASSAVDARTTLAGLSGRVVVLTTPPLRPARLASAPTIYYGHAGGKQWPPRPGPGPAGLRRCAAVPAAAGGAGTAPATPPPGGPPTPPPRAARPPQP